MRNALVECCRTAGTTSSFKYLMNSAASFSTRSAVSPTVLLTRADVSSTLRLKSFIAPQILTQKIRGHDRRCHYFAPALPRSIETLALCRAPRRPLLRIPPRYAIPSRVRGEEPAVL